jgi:predicted unusual protein kinase regulating ubiquinone biosynthesis (AarF/ABC1/UbiB family)
MAKTTDKIKQYRKFIGFMIKYWNSSLFDDAASAAFNDGSKSDARSYEQSPDELVSDLEQMGPTYVKLGQLLSTRPDLLPKQFLDALAGLQDSAASIPFEQVQEIIESELGTRISKAFADFQKNPLASASIGQVHKATLRSGGDVAVKIQRPGIKEDFLKDLNTLQDMAGWAADHSETARKYAFDDVIEDLRRILLNELNYKQEVQNLIRLNENLKSFSRLHVPQPVMDYCTPNVITMEFIEGQKVVDISDLKLTELNATPLADDLVKAYLKQVIENGFVHADPHPGNIHFTDDYEIALLDLGMVAQISATNQDYLLQLMAALGDDNGEEAAEILIEMGQLHEPHDLPAFRKSINQLVMQSQNTSAGDMHTGRLLIQMNQSAVQNGIKVPVEINILGKVLLNLDQIIAVLAPDFSVRDAINRHIQELMQSKMMGEIKPQNFITTVLESKKLAEALPQRLNKFTEQLANNEYTLKIDALDEKRLTDGFQKVANRITLGLIIAAMIIGAAMLMSVPTEFTLFGYPGLAMIFFLLSALGGLTLTYYIIFKDEDLKK